MGLLSSGIATFKNLITKYTSSLPDKIQAGKEFFFFQFPKKFTQWQINQQQKRVQRMGLGMNLANSRAQGATDSGNTLLMADKCLSQGFSTCAYRPPVGVSNDPFPGVAYQISCESAIYIRVHHSSKVAVIKEQGNNFMAGDHHNGRSWATGSQHWEGGARLSSVLNKSLQSQPGPTLEKHYASHP